MAALLGPLDTPQLDVGNAVGNAAELRKAIAAAVLAGDDAEAARLMGLLGKPRLRAIR
ncbi:MAG: hypothetical protein U0270_41220 [Labilithrix sp.]